MSWDHAAQTAMLLTFLQGKTSKGPGLPFICIMISSAKCLNCRLRQSLSRVVRLGLIIGLEALHLRKKLVDWLDEAGPAHRLMRA